MKPRSSIISVIASLIILFACFTQIASTSFIGDVNPTLDRSSRYESSYVVERFNSTHYQATNGTSGAVEFGPSTNASYIWNSARNALGTLATGATGSIFVKKATYNSDSPWVLGQRTALVAESGAYLNVTANCNGIVIDSSDVRGCNWQVRNLNISMNQKNGHGIYSLMACRKDSAMGNPVIDSVTITKVAVGYCGMNLTNLFLTTISNVHISTYGYGIWLDLDNNLEAGNSELNHIWIGLSGNNAVGLRAESTAAKHYVLLTFNWLEIISTSTFTGTIGVDLNEVFDSTFIGLDIEDCVTGLLLNGTRYNSFINPTIRSACTTGYGVRIVDSSLYGGGQTPMQNIFDNGYLSCTDVASVVYSDEGTNTYDKNRLRGTKVQKTWSLGSSTVCDGAYLYSSTLEVCKRTENTIVLNNVVNNTWISHNLPDFGSNSLILIQIGCSYSHNATGGMDKTLNAYPAAVNSTKFLIWGNNATYSGFAWCAYNP